MGCNCPEKVVNFAGAMARAAVALAVGKELLVAPATRNDRLAVCVKCPHFQPATAVTMPTCALCGCVVKLKAWLSTERCPDTPARWTTSQPAPEEPGAPANP